MTSPMEKQKCDPQKDETILADCRIIYARDSLARLDYLILYTAGKFIQCCELIVTGRERLVLVKNL